MALISCSECGKELSDKAAACPHCGNPSSERAPEDPRKQQLFDAKGRPRQPYDWELEKAGLKPPRKRNPLVIMVSGLLLVVILAWLSIDTSVRDVRRPELTDEQRAFARKLEKQKDDILRAQRAVQSATGAQCLSGLDGSHWAFKREIRDSLRNPKSFEHIETRITPKTGDGTHLVIMKYRGENGFGGMTVGTATASVKNSDCSHTVLSSE